MRGSKMGLKNNSPVKITATKHNALALVGVHAITMVLDADRMGSLQRVERRINSGGREKKNAQQQLILTQQNYYSSRKMLTCLSSHTILLYRKTTQWLSALKRKA